MRFHPAIDQYLDYIKDNERYMCEEQLALREFIYKELEKAVIDKDKIDKHLEVAPKYFFPLMPWQKFFIALTDGVYDKEGLLLFNEYLLMGGRGLGKNGFASAESWYLISNLHGVRNYNINIVATSEKQAMTSFNDVYDMIEHKGLQRAVHMTKEKITFRATNSILEYVTANPKTKDGGRPGAVIFDEIHAYETDENINVHTSGLGKIEKPRIYKLTTDGYVREGVLDRDKVKAHDILFNGGDHHGMLPIIFKLDKEEEVHDESLWIKANPRLDYAPGFKQEIRRQYARAKDSDSDMSEFMTKRMNIPRMPELEIAATHAEIMDAKKPIPIDLTGYPCIGVIDYASLKDFCAVGLLFYVDGVVYYKGHSFVHHGAVNKNYKFPIQKAIDKGLITVSHDPVIGADRVYNWFYEQASDYHIVGIFADAYRFAALKEPFENAGVELKTVRSGPITHSRVHPLISQLFAERRIIFGDDMVMAWYTGNVGVNTDGKGNKTYIKLEPILRKTDGFFALMHGMSELDLLSGHSDFYIGEVIT